MKYQISVIPTVAPCTAVCPRFTYQANTHPTVGEYLYFRDKKYKVISVGHVLTTSVIGAYLKHNLEEVEIIVVEE